jgi:hydrogenase maturation protein HypF
MTWGGEVLIASFAGFERFAHLEYLPLPGSTAADRLPWRIAAGYAHTFGIDVDRLPFLQNVDKRELRLLRQQIDRDPNSSLTSSMGRLFDAVASLIGVRNEDTYEAQSAIEMEVLSKPFIAAAKAYPYTIDETENGAILRVHELLQSIVEDVRAGESIGRIGAGFHRTVADMAIKACERARASTGLNEVALSGGVWQNQILLDLVRDGLRKSKFMVYFHKQVPTNDGGLSLGQAAIANHLVAKRHSTVQAISV